MPRNIFEEYDHHIASPTLNIINGGRYDYTAIPPRQWLLGNVFCRRFLSSLVADGAVGKTAVRLAQLLSLAIGRSLTGEHVFQRGRVLLVSLEDDEEEIGRRVYALLRHYWIDPAEIDGWLFWTAPRGIKLAQLHEGAPAAAALETLLREQIDELQLDIVCLDPFVKSHALNENDNGAMDFVCGLLATIALEKNCAIDSPHHCRKGSNTAGNSDNGRGASAQKDAARLGYTLTPMTPDEAKTFGLNERDRRSLVRMDSAKVNLCQATTEAKWFKLLSVDLGNATEMYPSGDHVQAAVPWTPPDIWRGIADATLNQILDDIDAGMPDGRRYSGARSAKTRAAWPLVQKHIPDRTEAQARAMIATWLKTGLLVSEPYTDPRDRKEADGLRVHQNKRPGTCE